MNYPPAGKVFGSSGDENCGLGKGKHLVLFSGLEKSQRRHLEHWLRHRGMRQLPGAYLIDLKGGNESAQLFRLLQEATSVQGLCYVYPIPLNAWKRSVHLGQEGGSTMDDEDYYIV